MVAIMIGLGKSHCFNHRSHKQIYTPALVHVQEAGGKNVGRVLFLAFYVTKKCYLRVFSVNKIVIFICICGFKVCVVISDS